MDCSSIELIIFSIDNRWLDDIVTGKQGVPWQITTLSIGRPLRFAGSENANICI
jgi:hypothetical protein